METRFMNRIIGLVLALVVGGLLVGGLLIPTVSAIQNTVGDPITYTNGGNNAATMDYYDNDFSLVYENNAVTIGDYTLERTNTDYRIMYWEYGRAILNRTAATHQLSIYDYRTSANAINVDEAATITYSASEKTLTVTKNSDSSTIATITANTVMCLKDQGEYVFVAASGIGDSYFTQKDVKDNKLGYLDTTITYNELSLEIVYNKSGIVIYGLPEGTEYTATLEVVGATLVEGTSDVYRGGTPTFTITIGEDTITESTYRFGQAVIKEAHGHERAGSIYALFGVISILGIVALVVVAANGIRNKY